TDYDESYYCKGPPFLEPGPISENLEPKRDNYP
ncbi:unnamed protein product, partial [marine sediment metagenome]